MIAELDSGKQDADIGIDRQHTPFRHRPPGLARDRLGGRDRGAITLPVGRVDVADAADLAVPHALALENVERVAPARGHQGVPVGKQQLELGSLLGTLGVR